ncbi:MAG: carbohydrate ABC transporter permease [Anaerolineae bacterium]
MKKWSPPSVTQVRENIAGYLFITPAVFLIFLFGIFPIGYAFYMSIHRWNIRQGSFFCTSGDYASEVTGMLGIAVAVLRDCLRHYEDSIIGSWQGAAVFIIGFAVLFISFRFWNNFWKAENNSEFAMRVGLAVITLAGSLAIITQGYSMMTGNLSSRNQDFLRGLEITFFYAVGSIPLQLILGLVLAYVLFQNIKGKELFRMLFFLPYITPTVAAAVVFGVVFSGRDTSLMNQVLVGLGGEAQRWISEPRPFVNVVFGWDLSGFLAGPSMALVTVIILGVWTYTGYNAVIFLAGLGNIPNDLYEAARVDGATEWHLFRHITLPLLSPITFYLSILGFIGTFTAFNTLFIMRTPAAQGTLNTSALVIFDTFRSQNRWGEAAAQAIVLFLIILVMTQIQRSVFEKRVFYG